MSTWEGAARRFDRALTVAFHRVIARPLRRIYEPNIAGLVRAIARRLP